MTVSDYGSTPQRRPLARRIALIVGEIVLILLAVALIAAILTPVYFNVSDDPDRYEFFGPPARRR